ncbi:DUF445 domain-containing protein [Chitinilyticum piscinae]|uniref:DUF445 domain-containing protein n=1 Tax=Chitinilyticum piscinae TaxID=2866724 RepID=A0A8J7K288_9NEIS|nr:DUF445 domain-containing protein [Chitinilyticum piscinae]MBE9610226.1 DUF445 domain-containing protein [Chitinilyticum piscinae]
MALVDQADLDDMQLKVRRLQRGRRLALGLLLAATVLFVVAASLRGGNPLWGYVAAFAEAAMIGALADWFAVVALFRHPMGIPLAHTAIIPRNKSRIAESLGTFITSNFLSTERVLSAVREFNPASQMMRWLAKPHAQQWLNELLFTLLGQLLLALNDRRVMAFFGHSVQQRLQQLDLSPLLASLLDGLAYGKRHHRLLEEVLRELDRQLDDPDIQEQLVGVVAAEMNILRYVSLDRAAARYITEKLVHGVQRELRSAGSDHQHRLRQRLDGWLAELANQLRHDPALQQRLARAQHELLVQPELAAQLHSLWLGVLDWVAQDIQQENSKVRLQLEGLTATLAVRLRRDPAMRAWINEQVEATIPGALARWREPIADFIAQQVKDWDDRTMVERLELNIGTDLQYIRINGTLVGGLIGLLLYGLAQLLRLY